MVKHLFHAITFIHDKGYVHGDITLRNIIVFPQQDRTLIFKLTDFENYIRHNASPEGTFQSTEPYRSSEILFKKRVTKKSDYWCLAVCVYIFYTQGSLPFICDSSMNSVNKRSIKRCDYNKEPVAIQDPNDPARRLMDRLFDVNIKKIVEILSQF